ncbi:MAG: type II toxin-antitoxin system RelE/ParE family toxin [Clostridia bacterium]|jgi:toxin ParE1/3/4|nr:type II toxin-antitoxin system RelE/ParE family toxin [Clostridia bacterium]
MDKNKLKFSALFYKDLEKIMKYIAKELKNPIAAKNLNQSIRVSIERRAESPEGYKPYQSTKKRNRVYFRMYVKNYIIFYTIEHKTMTVRRILYKRRNLEKII